MVSTFTEKKEWCQQREQDDSIPACLFWQTTAECLIHGKSIEKKNLSYLTNQQPRSLSMKN